MDERHAYWLAAAIDGEGSIVIRIRPGRVTATVTLTIAQNDRRFLERAQEYTGAGHIYGGIGPLRNGHQWQVFRHDELLRVLTDVEPFLVLKGPKAREALRVLPPPRLRRPPLTAPRGAL